MRALLTYVCDFYNVTVPLKTHRTMKRDFDLPANMSVPGKFDENRLFTCGYFEPSYNIMAIVY